MAGLLRFRSLNGHHVATNRVTNTRARLSHHRHNIALYKSVMIALGVVFVGYIIIIIVFNGFFPKLHCYLANHNEIPVSKNVHCGWKSSTESSMELLLQSVTTMLRFMDVPYFLNGDLLLNAAPLPDWATQNYAIHEATIGILPAGLEKLQKNNHNLPPRYHLTVYRSRLHDPGKRDPSIVARIIDRSTDLFVDIHEFTPMFHTDGVTPYLRSIWSQSWHRCQSCEIRPIDNRRQFFIPFEWVMPLVDCQYHGINATCPAKPLQLLHYHYQLPLYSVDLEHDGIEYTAAE